MRRTMNKTAAATAALLALLISGTALCHLQ
jgi:hypothetical protein